MVEDHQPYVHQPRRVRSLFEPRPGRERTAEQHGDHTTKNAQGIVCSSPLVSLSRYRPSCRSYTKVTSGVNTRIRNPNQYFVFVIISTLLAQISSTETIIAKWCGISSSSDIYTLSSPQGHKQHKARERSNHGAVSQ